MPTRHFTIRLDSVHQLNVSHKQSLLPRKADGDTVPLLRETITLIPVSTKGTEKSTTSDLSSLIVSEPMAMSARLYTTWRGWEPVAVERERELVYDSCSGSTSRQPLFFSRQRSVSW